MRISLVSNFAKVFAICSRTQYSKSNFTKIVVVPFFKRLYYAGRRVVYYLPPFAKLTVCAVIGVTMKVKDDKVDTETAAGNDSSSKSLLDSPGNFPRDEELTKILKHAVVAWQFGDLDESERLYHQALQVIADRHSNKIISDPQMHRARAYVLSHLANLNVNLGKLDRSERLFISMMQDALASGLEPNDETLVECSLKLSNLYAAQEKHDKARKGYTFCVAVQRERLRHMEELEQSGENHSQEVFESTVRNSRALLGIVESSYGRYLLSMGQPSSALTHLFAALKLARRLYPSHHPNCVSLLSDIGSTYLTLNQSRVALEHLQEALTTAQLTLKSDFVSEDDVITVESMLPVIRVNLGRVLLAGGDFVAAADHCLAAKRLARKLKDDTSLREADLCLSQIKNSQKS